MRPLGLRFGTLSPALALLVALAGTGPVMAQVQFSATAGAYLPHGVDPLISELGGVNGAPVPYPVFEKWQTGGTVLTARGSWWITGRAGLEGTLGLSPVRVATRDSLNSVREASARLVLASARAAVRLTPITAPLVFQFDAGLGYISRGGRAWNGIGGTGDIAFVASVAAQGKFNQRSPVFFRLELEDFVSRVQYRVGVWNPTAKQVHHDMSLSLGAGFPFSPRRGRS